MPKTISPIPANAKQPTSPKGDRSFLAAVSKLPKDAACAGVAKSVEAITAAPTGNMDLKTFIIKTSIYMLIAFL
ncbi:hypothetical protein [Desulfovibrio fairfieldensis]|uniref:hypothetical protein n=1 Tax=Desulfovibrio fairfieldensis TaxID=44742 RepID=UPI00123744FB|nr:hypothetical protein [Desulfovibrio fairfieldensis]